MAEYKQWVREHAQAEPVANMFGNQVRLKLLIAAVEGDERKRPEGFPGRGEVVFGTQVTIDGQTSGFSHSDFGSKGASGMSMSPDALKRLNELLPKLPEDGLRLPPAGRRMMIQWFDADRPVVRIYDRANAPDTAWEIARLCGSGIGSWMPLFQPNDRIQANNGGYCGFFAVSPDGKQLVFSTAGNPIQLRDHKTHELVKEIPASQPFSSITFSPNGTKAVACGSIECVLFNTSTWKPSLTFAEPWIDGSRYPLSCPQFTADGRYLLAQSGKPALRIFDARTWVHADQIPDAPEDLLQYAPAPTIKRALVKLKNGKILLWNLEMKQEVAQLDTDGYLGLVTFSPDQSMVAAVIADKQFAGQPQGERHIRLWKTDTGELVHGVWPFERSGCESVDGLMWSPDGQYVLAASKARGIFGARGISAWNVKTGRHRGQFTGTSNITGMGFIAEGRQLVAGCSDGNIHFWDFAEAMKQIRAFEQSLSAEPAP